jgi:MFS family permease
VLGRGGLMFMLIIWLQGIWLPRHGYTFAVTPLWAGIYIIPLTTGFLIGGPVSGILSDRYGSRPFATFGMLGSAVGFFLLEQVPVDFSYSEFGVLLFFMGLVMGSFGASNRTGVMNSLPAADRGAGSGMNTTFQNSAQVLSIGIFFTLIILGLSAHLPAALVTGLTAQGVPEATARSISHLPPVSTLFAAFLGYNPASHLLGSHVLSQLTPGQRATITGERFFPSLITNSFKDGLHAAFDFAIVMCLAGAACSWTRGGKVPARATDDDAPVENLLPEPVP